MRKTNINHIFLVRNALCVTHGCILAGELGRGSVENLASEPSQPANVLFITGTAGEGN